MFLSSCLLAMLPAAAPITQQVTAAAPTADGKMLFVAMMGDTGAATPGGFVCVWDLSKPELKAVVPNVPTGVRVIQPSPDGKRFVIVAGDDYKVTHLEVYDTSTKKLLHALKVPEKDYGIGAASPDGQWVAYRSMYTTELRLQGVKVWNTETGKHAEAVEVASLDFSGVPVFSADSKKLLLVSQTELAEFDLKTAKKTGGWKRTGAGRAIFREGAGWLSALPNGKGIVSVAPTGKRRQSYQVNIITEKKDWLVAEFWDRASSPTISRDGRLFIITGHENPAGAQTFALKLDADGNPELEDRQEKGKGPWVPDLDNKVPAWREWSLEEGKREEKPPRGRFGTLVEREYLRLLTFSPDGKRVFVGDLNGNVRAYDPESGKRKATFFNATPKKDELPAWHILTATGEVVGSPREVEALVKDGKKEDAAKVKEALGVK